MTDEIPELATIASTKKMNGSFSGNIAKIVSERQAQQEQRNVTVSSCCCRISIPNDENRKHKWKIATNAILGKRYFIDYRHKTAANRGSRGEKI